MADELTHTLSRPPAASIDQIRFRHDWDKKQRDYLLGGDHNSPLERGARMHGGRPLQPSAAFPFRLDGGVFGHESKGWIKLRPVTDSFFRKWINDAGLWTVVLMTLVLYFLVALLANIVLEQVFGDSEYEALQRAQTAFTIFNFVLGLIFYRWVNRQTSGYSARPRDLKSIMISLEKFLNQFTASARRAYQGERGRADPNVRRNHLVERVCYHSVFVFSESYFVYANLPDDVKRLSRQAYIKGRLEVLGVDNLVKVFGTDGGLLLHRDTKALTAVRNLTSDPVRDVRQELGEIYKVLKDLEVERFISPQEWQMFVQTLDEVERKLQGFEIMTTVYEPPQFTNLDNAALFTFFLLWVPFYLHVSLRWWSLLFYPITMFFLTGYFFVRWALGDPFRAVNPNTNQLRYTNWVPAFIATVAIKLKSYHTATTTTATSK